MAEDVPITQPPIDPQHVEIFRNDTTFTLKWGKPSQASWGSRPDRWLNTDATFEFFTNGVMNQTWVHSNDGSRYVVGDKIWVHDLGVATEATAEMNRGSYHPKTLNRLLDHVTGYALIQNGVGESKKGAVYYFMAPLAPKFGAPTLDTSTNEISVDVSMVFEEENTEVYESAGVPGYMYITSRECYDIAYWVTITDNFTSTYSKSKIVKEVAYSEETTTTISIDVTDYQDVSLNLRPGQWVCVTFFAYARGINGNSETVKTRYVFAHPEVPSITEITVTKPSLSSGIVNIGVNLGSMDNWKYSSDDYLLDHLPIESVKLQRLKNTLASTADAAGEITEGWDDVTGAVDNWNCKGFTDVTVDAMPDRGYYTYYRVVSTNGTFIRHGEPYLAEALDRGPNPVADDEVAITSVESGSDGESLIVYLAWTDDDSTATEVSWSDREDAWMSTEQPSTYDVTWEDSQANPPSGTNWTHTAYLVIRGLTESTKYYIKARRFSEADSERVYSTIHATPPSSSYPAVPYTSPSNVALSTVPYFKSGSDLDFTWTFDSTSPQKKWILYRVKSDNSVVQVAKGDDSVGVATLTADSLAEMVEDQGDSTLTFYVSLSTGGAWVDSKHVSATMQSPPNLVITTSETIVSQPVQFSLKSDVQNLKITGKLVAEGVMALTPDGEDAQLKGDIVWSDAITTSLYEADSSSGEKYMTVISMPFDLRLYDGCRYYLKVLATDSETGLSSDEQIMLLTVDYDHKAQSSPDVGFGIDRDARSVSITPEKPTNWQAGDVFDLYRMTMDGVYKITEGTEFGATVLDRYAPYAKVVPLKYRVCTRTKDNDLEWIDFDYSMHIPTMRFDWDGLEYGYVELPFDVEVSDQYEKDFESRTHIDGTTIGYWNSGVAHKGNLKTKVLRLSEPEQIRRVHELSQHSGPVFVRLPNGLAYTANVTVTSIDDAYTKMVKNVSITAEEIDLVDAFKPVRDDFTYVSGFVPSDFNEPYSRKQLLTWTTDRTSLTGVYTLNEAASGTVAVELTVSSDGFVNKVYLNATHTSQNPRTLTVNTLSTETQNYVNVQPAGTQFILRALYNV